MFPRPSRDVLVDSRRVFHASAAAAAFPGWFSSSSPSSPPGRTALLRAPDRPARRGKRVLLRPERLARRDEVLELFVIDPRPPLAVRRYVSSSRGGRSAVRVLAAGRAGAPRRPSSQLLLPLLRTRGARTAQASLCFARATQSASPKRLTSSWYGTFYREVARARRHPAVGHALDLVSRVCPGRSASRTAPRPRRSNRRPGSGGTPCAGASRREERPDETLLTTRRGTDWGGKDFSFGKRAASVALEGCRGRSTRRSRVVAVYPASRTDTEGRDLRATSVSAPRGSREPIEGAVAV